MSSTASTTAAPASSAAPVRPGHAGARKTGTESGPDLFANLLSLVGDTHGTPAPDASLPNADRDPADDTLPGQDPSAHNPLTDLLGWYDRAGLTGTPGAAPGTPVAQDPGGLDNATTAAVAGTGLAPGEAAQTGDRQGMALDRLGMTPVGPDDSQDALVMPDAAAAAAETASPAAAAALSSRHAAPAAQAAGPGLQRAQGSPTNWRKAGPSGSAATPGLDSSAPESTRGRQHAYTAQLRSTVALDERYGQSRPGEAAPSAASSASSSGGLAGAPRQGGESAPSPALSGPAETAAPPEHSTEGPAREATGPADPSAEAQSESVSHWGTQNLRHASLRVGQPGEDAIDIQLSLSGQEVRVDFRTDSAEARASLQHSASASLGDLLQGSGIQLGSVSVGSQGQPPQRDGSPPGAEQTASRHVTRPPAAPEAASAPLRPRSDGSRPLDVFA
jgi:hypothetical protein